MKVQKKITLTVTYKLNAHKRVNKIKLIIVYFIGWLLNKLFALTIEMDLVEKKA